MNNEFSLKELYDVSLKTTCKIEIGGKTFEVGETIATFDKINLANFSEIRKVVSANGGAENPPLIWWETVKDIQLTFTQGIFNETQLGLLTNAKIVKPSSSPIFIPKQVKLSIDEENTALAPDSCYSPVFVYDYESGDTLTYKFLDNECKHIKVENPEGNEILVDYWQKYENEYTTIVIGQQLTNTYLELFGKTRVKEDDTGVVRTAIIHIPLLKLMSDLSMRLGSQAAPVMGSLYAIACPYGERGNKRVMELIFLDEDIDTDI